MTTVSSSQRQKRGNTNQGSNDNEGEESKREGRGIDTFLQRRPYRGIRRNHRILGSSSLISTHSIPRIPNRTRRILRRLPTRPNPCMKPRPSPHKMRIIHRRHNTHNTRTPRINMTKIITQRLQIVHRQLILVHQNRVVRRPARPLQAGVREEEEVVELWVDDVGVDDGACRAISGAVGVATVEGEEAGVVAFRDNDEGDVWAVAFFEGFAGGANGFDFGFDDVGELAFGDTVAEE
jgi:hypothetical protein